MVGRESANEHGDPAAAVQAKRIGSLPLALLHVEEALVLVVRLRITEQGR
jgi:hypothetical protein